MVLGLFEKNKYQIIFLKKTGGVYDRIGKKKLNPKKDSITFGKEKTFPIDFQKIGYRSGTKSFIYVDIDKGQIDFSESTLPVPLMVIDTFVSKGILKNIISRLQTGNNQIMPIMVAIILLVAGVFIGYFIGNVLPFEQIRQAIQNFHWGG